VLCLLLHVILSRSEESLPRVLVKERRGMSEKFLALARNNSGTCSDFLA
jgi:hypothetical protein